MLDTGVDDDALEIVESGDTVIIRKKAPLNPKDADGYYLIEGLTGISSGSYLYSTPEGKLTVESAGNTPIAKFECIKNKQYLFSSTTPKMYVGTNDIQLYAALPNNTEYTDDTGFKYTNYIYNSEQFKNGSYPLFELTYNFTTPGTKTGDWIIPQFVYYQENNINYVTTSIMQHFTDDIYDANVMYIQKGTVMNVGMFDVIDGKCIYDPDYGFDYRTTPIYLQPALIVKNKS